MTNPTLRVDADLRFTLADGGRRASGSVAAAGDTVTVTVDRPWAALQALRTAALPGGGFGRTAAAPVADALSEAGLRLAVVGPNGPLLTLGRDVHSAVGRRVAGSDRVAVRPVALLDAGRARRVLVAAGAAAVAVAVIVSARRAGSRSAVR